MISGINKKWIIGENSEKLLLESDEQCLQVTIKSLFIDKCAREKKNQTIFTHSLLKNKTTKEEQSNHTIASSRCENFLILSIFFLPLFSVPTKKNCSFFFRKCPLSCPWTSVKQKNHKRTESNQMNWTNDSRLQSCLHVSLRNNCDCPTRLQLYGGKAILSVMFHSYVPLLFGWLFLFSLLCFCLDRRKLKWKKKETSREEENEKKKTMPSKSNESPLRHICRCQINTCIWRSATHTQSEGASERERASEWAKERVLCEWMVLIALCFRSCRCEIYIYKSVCLLVTLGSLCLCRSVCEPAQPCVFANGYSRPGLRVLVKEYGRLHFHLATP